MLLAIFRSCLTAAALLCCPASHAAFNSVTLPPASSPVPFSITLHVANAPGYDYFDLDNPHASFDVIIKNVSAKPQAVWSDQCSWGYGIVSLRVMAIDGKLLSMPVNIEPAPRAWSANFPVSDILVPRAEIVRHVLVSELPFIQSAVQTSYSKKLNSADNGGSLPAQNILGQTRSGRFEIIKAVAILNTLSTGNTAKFNTQQRVWSGKVVSAPITFKTGL